MEADPRTLAARTAALHLARDARAAVVKGWRDDHPPTPHARYDLLIVDHWAPRIQRALARIWTAGQLRLAIDTASRVAPLGTGHADHDAVHRDLVSSVARGHLRALGANLGPLRDALRGLTADAWTVGRHVAGIQVAGVTKASAAATPAAAVVTSDWDTWEPGHPEAAIRTADGALRDALDAVDLTLRGLSDTTIDKVGNIIGDGLLDGDSVDEIATALRGYLGLNAVRGEMIAHTEAARAMTSASIDGYAAEGYRRWNWMTTSGACPICLSEESANPHALGDSAPPAHPRCRCAVAPVIESHVDWVDTDEPAPAD